MSNAPQHLFPGVNPRPGVLKTLGILNIVFASLSAFCIGSMGFLMIAIANTPGPESAKVEIQVQTNQAPSPGVPMSAGFDPFMGMRDKSFIRFSIVDSVVSLILSGLMFATGLGLLNRKRWGATGWAYVAWVRIVSVVIVWGYFIVAVSPSYSEATAKGVLAQMGSQGAPPGGLPPLAFMTQVYLVMNLIVALMAMVITSIYPAVSLWLLSRPGVKAALIDQYPSLEQELP